MDPRWDSTGPMVPAIEPEANSLYSAADAAVDAARDAQAAAGSATGTSLAAGEAAQATAEVARLARAATAAAVAAAASSTALLAARTAAAVEVEAISRAVDAATSASAARDTVASELADDADPSAARQAAAVVANAVDAEVVARSLATADAAALVADAVTAAAEAAFVAAQSAAATVKRASDMAAASGRVVAGSSTATRTAADVVVESTARAAELAPELRAAAVALRQVTLARHPLVPELHSALARAELRLHYQPIYNLQTGALTGVEALLRWQHPTRGLLSPAQFLDVVEGHRDLLLPVGDWVLTTAVTQAATWRRTFGERAPKMWVNISGDQLGPRQQLPALVERLLSGAGLCADALGLEVTERQLIQRAHDVAVELEALRELGIALAVDDFGTGYASLDYLRRFNFDEIKIDRSFIVGLGSDRTDTAVTASIIALGNSLDLNVVAEGVETQAQYDGLKQLGCAMAQGYLMHRPAAPEALCDVIAGRAPSNSALTR